MVFGFFKFTFLIILITGNESNFMFSKNSTKLSKVVNNIDGDGDKENRIGIKCYVKMVLSYKDYFFLLFE
jgi:hypothetical protein